MQVNRWVFVGRFPRIILKLPSFGGKRDDYRTESVKVVQTFSEKKCKISR